MSENSSLLNSIKEGFKEKVFDLRVERSRTNSDEYEKITKLDNRIQTMQDFADAFGYAQEQEVEASIERSKNFIS